MNLWLSGIKNIASRLLVVLLYCRLGAFLILFVNVRCAWNGGSRVKKSREDFNRSFVYSVTR